MAREERGERGVVGLGGLGGLGAGVKVELAGAVGELREEAREGGGGHATGGAQAEDAVGEMNAVLFQMRNGGAAEALENPGREGEWAGFAHEAHGAKAVLGGDGQREPKDRGMEMEMRVAVPITRRETERAEARELRADLALKRLGERWRKGVAQSGARRRCGEISAFIRERGDLRGASGAEREMEADAERGIAPGDVCGFGGGGLIDHDARLREEAGPVGALDGGVDFRTATEVVGGDDEVFQWAERAGRLRRCTEILNRHFLTTDYTDYTDFQKTKSV